MTFNWAIVVYMHNMFLWAICLINKFLLLMLNTYIPRMFRSDNPINRYNRLHISHRREGGSVISIYYLTAWHSNQNVLKKNKPLHRFDMKRQYHTCMTQTNLHFLYYISLYALRFAVGVWWNQDTVTILFYNGMRLRIEWCIKFIWFVLPNLRSNLWVESLAPRFPSAYISLSPFFSKSRSLIPLYS